MVKTPSPSRSGPQLFQRRLARCRALAPSSDREAISWASVPTANLAFDRPASPKKGPCHTLSEVALHLSVFGSMPNCLMITTYQMGYC